MPPFVSLTGSAEIAAARSRLGLFDGTARLVAFANMVQPRMTQAIMDAAPRGWRSPSGRLAESTRSTRRVGVGLVSMEWHTDVPYAPFVLGGTRAHEIVARKALVLHWTDRGGAHHFARRVRHPGTQPFDYPRVALRAQMPWIAATFHTAFERI